MQSDTIALNGDTYTTTTEGSLSYDRIGWEGPGNGSLFRVAATSQTEPETLSFRSQEIKRNGTKRRRSNVRVDTNRLDAENVSNNCNFNFTVDAPVETGLTEDEIKASAGRIIAYLAVEANLVKLLNGER